MTTPGPYSRIYWRFRDEYPDIYADKETFGWWSTLLMIAEGSHPSTAELPRKLRRSTLDKLVNAGLITLYSGDRFRVLGLEAERQRRETERRNGGTVRAETAERGPDGKFLATTAGTSTGSTAGNQPASNSKDEHRRAEQSKDETRTNARAGGLEPVGSVMADLDVLHPDSIPLDVRRLQRLAEELTGQAFAMNNLHSGYGKKAVAEQLPHGFDRVERAWRKIANQAKGEGTSKPTLRQLVLGADDILNPVPQQDSSEQREQAARELFDRRVARTQAELEETKKLMGYDA